MRGSAVNHRVLVQWLACLALGLLSQLALAAPPVVASVPIQGILQSGDFFGAPGYGDTPATDPLEPMYYLQLPAPLVTQVHPATLMGDFTIAAQKTHFVQLLVFDEEKSVARTLVGKRVRIVGTIVEPEGGHGRMPAVLQVKSLSAVREWQW